MHPHPLLRSTLAGLCLAAASSANSPPMSSKAVEKVITGQPTNVVMQFRIVAFNDAGEGFPSNTVEVKL